MASDAVAAGEGAFSTWMRFSRRTMRKSSAMRPSGSTAIARTPEGEAVRSSARISGTSRCSRRVKARFERERWISSSPTRHSRSAKRRNPE